MLGAGRKPSKQAFSVLSQPLPRSSPISVRLNREAIISLRERKTDVCEKVDSDVKIAVVFKVEETLELG